jgi:ribosomal protein S27AE
METFRHNLTPVEVKKFLQATARLTENLLLRYCWRTEAACPACGAVGLLRAAGLSLYSSSIDKLTHELRYCLSCGFQDLNTLESCERL